MKTRIALLALLLSTTVFGITTSHWTHTSEADFKAGTFHNVVATNLGDVKLSRAVQTILGMNEHVSAVHALAEGPDGTIYAGTGPEGVLLAIKDDKAETIANLGDNLNIFSLLIDSKGRLLIGASGEKGGIFRIDHPSNKPADKADDKPAQIFSEPTAQYIWSMCQTPDGKIYAATGPNGQLYEIEEDGTHKLLFDSEQNNLTSMVSDGKDMLFVGTDPDGLIYRINRKTGEMFVLFDAPEPEISALVLDKDGTLYAGTTAAAEAQPDKGDEKGASEQVGRPEGDTGGVSIPTQPPAAPKPPQPPAPAPGEPAPIPKHSSSEPKQLMIVTDDPGDPSGPDDPGEPPAGGLQPNKKPQAAATAAALAKNLAAKTAEGVAAPAAIGNAVYRIDKDGFVSEIFREPVVVHSLAEQNGSLLVGTGGEGMVYQVNPTAEETVVLAKVDPKDVISLLPTKDGRVFMGLANSGDIAIMTKGFASDGTYTSAVLDATQISRFGKLQLHGTLPKETKLTVATRSSNVGEDSDRGWSDWSAEQPAVEFLPIQSPPARYLQYRLSFSSADGKESPVVDDVDVAYQIPNLAPTIKSIKIATKADAPDPTAQAGAAKPPADHYTQTITWEAADPNSDPLEFSIYFRDGAASPWILLKDKLTDPTWDWDTRGVADGRYEIKVTASDDAANPRGMGKTASRVSDPLIVDNTAPVIGDITTKVTGTSVHIELRAVDRTSTIASLEYSVDSGTDWQSVLPSDNIADSPEEAYRFDTQPLSSGAHQITLRATDAHGNQTHESVTITVEAGTASK